MFLNCDNLDYINFKNIQSNSLTDMSGMFKGCTNLKYVNLLKLEISKKVTITDILYGLNDNILYCIYDESKALTIKEEFDKSNIFNFPQPVNICCISTTDEVLNDFKFNSSILLQL